MARTVRDVVFVDGVCTPFGKAGSKGIYAESRADDPVINCVRELLRRNRRRWPFHLGSITPYLDRSGISEVIGRWVLAPTWPACRAP